MRLFFQIQSLQLIIFCMDDQEFVANLVFYVFFCSIIIVNHFLYCFIILMHLISSFWCTITLFVSYAYVSIKTIDCIHLSSLPLNAMLLISSVNALCFLLLNLCYDFNTNLLFFMNSL